MSALTYTEADIIFSESDQYKHARSNIGLVNRVLTIVYVPFVVSARLSQGKSELLHKDWLPGQVDRVKAMLSKDISQCQVEIGEFYQLVKYHQHLAKIPYIRDNANSYRVWDATKVRLLEGLYNLKSQPLYVLPKIVENLKKEMRWVSKDDRQKVITNLVDIVLMLGSVDKKEGEAFPHIKGPTLKSALRQELDLYEKFMIIGFDIGQTHKFIEKNYV
jgi:hypothetical protein